MRITIAIITLAASVAAQAQDWVLTYDSRREARPAVTGAQVIDVSDTSEITNPDYRDNRIYGLRQQATPALIDRSAGVVVRLTKPVTQAQVDAATAGYATALAAQMPATAAAATLAAGKTAKQIRRDTRQALKDAKQAVRDAFTGSQKTALVGLANALTDYADLIDAQQEAADEQAQRKGNGK